MGDSFTLGRIAGIRIGINWSWLVVFVLIAWTLTAGVFPSTNPGLSDGTYLTMGVVAGLLFFVSLLLHELGHALQARREKMEIEGITLWLFGGVAKFKGAFPSAGAEFRIAAGGPLVSLVLGFAYVALALAGLPETVDAVVAWLGYVNLALLVFNLLPALPLDGGRLLRAALWSLRGDFAAATRTAASVARLCAYLLIAAGVALFVFQGAFSGAWLAFIGWFLLQAAGAEARDAVARQTLGDLTVGDLMIREPVTVGADLSIGRFMDEIVWANRYTTYPVVADGVVLGLVPFRRVAEVPRREWDETLVRDCMVERDQVPLLSPRTLLADALPILAQNTLRRALVLEDDRLVGLLSITDLARALEVGPPTRH